MASQYTHVSALIVGKWKSTSHWAEETAQMGIRVGCWPTISGSPSLDGALPIRDCESGYDVYDGPTLQGNIGFVGSGSYWNQGAQVDIAQGLVDYVTALKSFVNTNFEWTGIKLSAIAPSGKTDANSTLLNLKTPIAGTAAGGVNYPPQVAVAVSLRSIVPGRRGRGRMYLPAIAGSSVGNADGTVSSNFANPATAAMKALVEHVDNVGSEITYKVVVTSATAKSYVLPTEARVGNHFDTQQRRRHQVRETYTSVAL